MGKEHTNHLIAAFKENYNLKKDPEGSKYVGIFLGWDYIKGEVHLSMPGYIAETLRRVKHIWTSKPKDQQDAHVTPNYGMKVQYAADADKSQPVNKGK